MPIKISDFIQEHTISILVNFQSKIKGVTNDMNYGYVLEKRMIENINVIDYLKEKTKQAESKIEQSLQLVKLKSNIHYENLSMLTDTEIKKVQLAEVLLIGSKTIILEHFFSDLIFSEKEYFKRFLKNLIYKKNMAVILIENDMNFVCETVKSFYLFTDSKNSIFITDFYDDEIYKYVEMPYVIDLIKFINTRGYSIDREITFNETLKAIYRGLK